jgi:hypothetical protein
MPRYLLIEQCYDALEMYHIALSRRRERLV